MTSFNNEEYVVERIVREREVLPTGEVGDWRIVSSTPVNTAPSYSRVTDSFASSSFILPVLDSSSLRPSSPFNSARGTSIASSYVPLSSRSVLSSRPVIQSSERPLTEKFLDFRYDDASRVVEPHASNGSTVAASDSIAGGHKVIYWDEPKTVSSIVRLEEEPRYRFVGSQPIERVVKYEPLAPSQHTYPAPTYLPFSSSALAPPAPFQPPQAPQSQPPQAPQPQFQLPPPPVEPPLPYASFGAEQAQELLDTVSQAPDPSINANEFRNITRDDFYRKFGADIKVPLEWEKVPLDFSAKNRSQLQAISVPVLSFIQHLKPVPIKDQRPVFLVGFPSPSPSNQKDQVLLCRRKKAKNKLRLSFDANKLVKSRNPGHAGTLVDKEGGFGHVRVQMAGKREIAVIEMKQVEDLLEIRLFITPQYCSNVFDPVPPGYNVESFSASAIQGLEISGVVYAAGVLNEELQFRVTGSDRICMTLSPASRIPNSNGSRDDVTLQHVLQVDYPMTVFLAFATASAVFSWRLARGYAPVFE